MTSRDNATPSDVLNKKFTRRRALSTAGKVGGAVVATAVVAGGLGYAGGYYTAPSNSKESTLTTTSTVTQTQTVTSTSPTTSSVSTTVSTATDSSSAANYVNYPGYMVTWPLDLRVDNPVSGLSGSVKAAMANSITYQTDTTVPGTRAYGVLVG